MHPRQYALPALLFAALLSTNAGAIDTSADETRIDELVTTINAANRKPDVPNLFGSRDGSMARAGVPEALPTVDSVAVPIDDESTASVAEPLPSDPSAPAVDAAPVAPTFVRGDTLAFEQLPQVIGRRIRVRTLTGRTYDGDLAAVRNGEISLHVRMYGSGQTVMPIKKAQISAMSML